MKTFNPLIFLASLGAGGIAVMPFAIFQYTVEHSKGLVKYADLGHGTLSMAQELLFRSMEGIMVVFAVLHFVLSFIFFKKLIAWMKTKSYAEYMDNPLMNAGILAPFLSLTMTFNVFIGPIRFFIPAFAENLQTFMLPALIGWIFVWIFTMRMEVKLLKTAFEKSFDVNKITFGWLLHPFAIGMVAVVGAGIAALSQDATIAHIAAFLTMVIGSMGFFLFLVKIIAIFKSHFAQEGLPERQFLPSFLIVMPNLTLYGITGFRLAHYMEHHLGMHVGPLPFVIILGAFAFSTWYLIFGLALLSDFFKKHFFKNEFYVTQWGLICPFVAYAVLGAFVFAVFAPAQPVTYAVMIITMFVSVLLYLLVFHRQLSCMGVIGKKGVECL